jgi:Cu/Ag efflux protein CusF
MRTAMAGFLSVATVSLAACNGGGGTPQEAASPAASPPQAPVAPAAGPGAVIGASPGGGATSSVAKQHDIRGRIEAISRDRGVVTLDHEEIPGVMAAMKMDYGVAEAALLDRLAVGDRVEGRIEERAGSYVIVTLKKR